MIVGIGIDTVKVERIAQKVQMKQFKEKVFSAEEIVYCDRNAHPAEHYAARFAAKEAFLKAIGTGFTFSYELNQISVTSDENGKPSLLLSGDFKTLESKWTQIHISLTHTDTIAAAFVILEK